MEAFQPRLARAGKGSCAQRPLARRQGQLGALCIGRLTLPPPLQRTFVSSVHIDLCTILWRGIGVTGFERLLLALARHYMTSTGSLGKYGSRRLRRISWISRCIDLERFRTYHNLPTYLCKMHLTQRDQRESINPTSNPHHGRLAQGSRRLPSGENMPSRRSEKKGTSH